MARYKNMWHILQALPSVSDSFRPPTVHKCSCSWGSSGLYTRLQFPFCMSTKLHNISGLSTGREPQHIGQDQGTSAKWTSEPDYHSDVNDNNEATLQSHTPIEKDITRAPEKPFSIFTRPQKWAIVVIASVAGLFRWAHMSYCLWLEINGV